MLHMTPYVAAIGFHVIAAETEKDEKMKLLAQIIQNELAIKEILRLMKSELADFKKLLPELSVMANGIILKGECIVLPETLQARALNLAHRGAHPGQGGMEPRIQSHFFIPRFIIIIRLTCQFHLKWVARLLCLF